MNVDDFLAVQAARADREERRANRTATLYLAEATVRVDFLDPHSGPGVWERTSQLLRVAADIAASMPGGRVAPLFPKVQGIGLDKNGPRP